MPGRARLGTQRQQRRIRGEHRLGVKPRRAIARRPRRLRDLASTTRSEAGAAEALASKNKPSAPRSTTRSLVRRDSESRPRCARRQATDTRPRREASRTRTTASSFRSTARSPARVKNAARTTRRSPACIPAPRTRRSRRQPEIDDGPLDASFAAAARSCSAASCARQIGLAELPATEVGVRAARPAARGAPESRDVGEHRAGISRSQALHPRHDELRFAQRQAVVVGEPAVARHRGPRRHVARDARSARICRPCSQVCS